ncbi:MAG: acyl carrier protein [Mycobacterium sp.]|jgi:acyl carrier protein|nr:acyl carrier protein [Mycobacterium sp.]
MTEEELNERVASFFDRPVAAIWSGVEAPPRSEMLTCAEVHAILVSVIEEVTGLDPREVTSEKAFIEELGVDSLSATEIAVRLEDKHGIVSPAEGLLTLRTVGDAVLYLQHALSVESPPR